MSHLSASTPEEPTRTFEDSYRELLPEFLALDRRYITRINLEIPAMVSRLLAAHTAILTNATKIQWHAPRLDVARMRRLDAYALALSHAHTLHLIATAPPPRLRGLIREARETRRLLLADGENLVLRALLKRSCLQDLDGPVGYNNLARDLQRLSALFRENLPQVQGKCATTPADLERAQHLAHQILTSVGAREQRERHIAQTADVRARAFAVVLKLYAQVRTAIQFARQDEGDAELLVPSLFIKRRPRKRRAPAVSDSFAPHLSRASGAIDANDP